MNLGRVGELISYSIVSSYARENGAQKILADHFLNLEERHIH